MTHHDSLEMLGERLQATLAELARTQERESHYRSESDTLLKGVAALADAQDLDAVLAGLIGALQPFIGFEAATVLTVGPSVCTPIFSSQGDHTPTCWPLGRAFERALAGETLVLYEPALLPDFLPVAQDARWRSVLVTGLTVPGFEGLLLCRHSRQGALDLKSKAALQRCRPLISQALVNIAYRSRLQDQVRLKTQALQLSKARFRSFAGMASDWFWECDAEHRLRYISTPDQKEAALSQNLVGMSLLELPLIPHEGEPDYHQLLGRLEPVRGLRAALRRKEGLVWLEINAAPGFDEAGRFVGYRGTARDISPQIRRELELAAARDSAQAASLAKSRFLAMMTHEIRSPMNAVLGMLDLLQSAPLGGDQRALLGHATHSAKLLQTIIDDVLDLSKIESGTLQIHCEEMDIRALCQLNLASFYRQGEEKGVAITLTVAPAVPEHLFGDPVRISQLIGNLVGNALKFTERGEIAITLDWRRERLCVAVEDSGIGIEESQVERLFEPFVQGDNSASRSYAGAGLGLAICKRLVHQMGGEIGVLSTLGQGSRFWFELPGLALPCEHHASEPEPDGPIRPLDILVVEDNRVNQLVVSLMLQRLVAGVRLCDSGVAALEQVALVRPDLIFMDMRMPQMDGLEATRRLRRLGYDGVIVALTANAMSDDRSACLAAGMDHFLAKPISLSQLRHCIDAYFPGSGG
ncbi:ATP-binding protein [Aeromonas diversa]|uniref:hybrid sensor histidine kinase/response regulator n=1 Tax=Aeromonas diversa TaxID=502790 RepID=UPI0039A1289F